MAKKETTKKTTTTKKPSRKAAPKTTARTRTPVEALSLDATTANKASSKPFKVRKSYVIFIVVIVALGALLFAGRSLFVAAVVNGQPISRLAIVKESEKQSGKQALQTMVRNTLIEQEARKANVSVSEKEIDDEVKKVEAQVQKQQGQKLDDVLTLQGMTRADLRNLIKLDKLVGKIVGREVKVSEKEVNDFIEKNREILPQDQSEDALKKMAEERLKQQKMNEKVSTWLESLQNKAKILYFVQY
jgi:foldase protein PrsA